MTLLRQWSRRALLAALCLPALGTVPAWAQHHPEHHGWHPYRWHMTPSYDVRTETRTTGVVNALETGTQPPCVDCRAGGATFLTLQTDKGVVEVHLGPTTFVQANEIHVAVGDEVDILGVRHPLPGGDLLLACEVRKGSATWTLRDPSGRPLWSGGCWGTCP